MSSRTHPRKPRRIPSYRLHAGSGRAVVTIDGRDHYFGRHGTDESNEAYSRLGPSSHRAPSSTQANTFLYRIPAATSGGTRCFRTLARNCSLLRGPRQQSA
jgi:hypothetical protein